jgi:hypothetical protein
MLRFNGIQWDNAILDLTYTENGTRLEVETPEGRRDLEVTDLPFLDKARSIPRRSLRS